MTGNDQRQLVQAGAVGHSFTYTDEGDLVYTAEVDGADEVFLNGDQLTASGDDITDPTWVPDREALVAFRSVDGDSQKSIVKIDPETGDIETVLDCDYFAIDLTPCPTDHGTVSLVASKEETLDIYALDIETGALVQLVETEYTIYHDWSPEGDAIVHQEGLSEHTSIHVSSPAGDTRVLRDEADSEQLFRPELALCRGSSVWSEHGILVASNEQRDTLDIGTVDPDDGELTWRVESPNEKISFGWGPADGEFAYGEYVDGDLRLKTWTDGEVQQVTDRGVTTTVQWTPDGAIAYRLSDYALPGGLFVSGTQVAGEVIDIPGLVAPEPVEFEAHDGLTLPGLLYEPEGADMALVHAVGGPGQTVSTDFQARTQALAREGIAVLSVAYRGCRGHGRAHSTANTGDLGGDDALDLAAGARFLRERGYDTVGVYGHSYGGYLSLMAAIKSDAFDVCINLAGPTDLVALVENARGASAAGIVMKMGGPPDELEETYRERSPINHVAEIDVPVMQAGAENDRNMPPEQIDRLSDRLDEQGTPNERVRYRDGHVLHNPDNKLDQIERIRSFCTEQVS